MGNSDADKSLREGKEEKEPKTPVSQVNCVWTSDSICYGLCRTWKKFIILGIFRSILQQVQLLLVQLLRIGLAFRCEVWNISSGFVLFGIDIVINNVCYGFVQAYSPMPPHGFLTSSPPTHPYMWGVQVEIFCNFALHHYLAIDLHSNMTYSYLV